MKDDKNKSVLKEALLEYKEIQDAAVANAKNNLAESYPDKFNDLLKEELNKNKKTTKESYKKLDESKESEKDDVDTNKESVMKDQSKETEEKVVNEGDENQPFEEKPAAGKDVVKEEREKEFMGDVEKETPNVAKGKEEEDGDAFDEKITTKKETLANKTSIKEEFDITELDMDSVGSALDNAESDDEIVTMNEIESEIQEMEKVDEEISDMGGLPRPEIEKFGTPENQEGDAYTELVKMKNKIDEMISTMGSVAEQKNHGGAGANKVNAGGPTQSMIDEEEITDADVEAVLGASEEVVDEAHGVTYAERRKSTGRHTPSPDSLSQGELDQAPEYVKESEKKINSLINENKSLTKKLNETKKYKQSVTTLVEQYKSALEKYRNQLKEMATFNTNLAHVNNLLVNESLALTQEDKINIINEFKKVDTIAESQEKYKSFLTEMTDSKKTISESIEEKVSASVAPSSKQKIDEAKEVTAYANDEHVNKMKRLIEYVENRGSKKII